MAPSGQRSPPGAEHRFEQWYADHFDYVWRSLRRLGVSPADVGDLTHDVFVVAWRQRDDVDPSRPVRPWLFGVAFRVASTHRRKRWLRWTRAEDVPQPSDPAPNPEQQALWQDELAQLDRALAAVPLRHRAVLLLADFDEEPVANVADALNLPLKTAYSRLATGRKLFRQAYRRAELSMFMPSSSLGEPQ